MGPLSPALKALAVKQRSDIKFDIDWTTLGEYLELLERRGVSTNVASFVGAATVRAHVVGFNNRKASRQELAAMQDLVRARVRWAWLVADRCAGEFCRYAGVDCADGGGA